MEAVTEVNGVPLVNEPINGLSNGVNLNETFDNFLTMLTTQLKNQDPLSPMDTAQFTEQLVMFSSVEQALATNQKLDQLIALQGGDRLLVLGGGPAGAAFCSLLCGCTGHREHALF